MRRLSAIINNPEETYAERVDLVLFPLLGLFLFPLRLLLGGIRRIDFVADRRSVRSDAV